MAQARRPQRSTSRSRAPEKEPNNSSAIGALVLATLLCLLGLYGGWGAGFSLWVGLMLASSSWLNPALKFSGKNGEPQGEYEEKQQNTFMAWRSLQKMLTPSGAWVPQIPLNLITLVGVSVAVTVYHIPRASWVPGWLPDGAWWSVANALCAYACVVAPAVNVRGTIVPGMVAPAVSVSGIRSMGPWYGFRLLLAPATLALGGAAGFGAYYAATEYAGYTSRPAIATGCAVGVLAICGAWWKPLETACLTPWRNHVEASRQWAPRWEILKQLPPPRHMKHERIGNAVVDSFDAPPGSTADAFLILAPKITPLLGTGPRVCVLNSTSVDASGQPIPGVPHPTWFRVVQWEESFIPPVDDSTTPDNVIELALECAAAWAADDINCPRPMLIERRVLGMSGGDDEETETEGDGDGENFDAEETYDDYPDDIFSPPQRNKQRTMSFYDDEPYDSDTDENLADTENPEPHDTQVAKTHPVRDALRRAASVSSRVAGRLRDVVRGVGRVVGQHVDVDVSLVFSAVDSAKKAPGVVGSLKSLPSRIPLRAPLSEPSRKVVWITQWGNVSMKQFVGGWGSLCETLDTDAMGDKRGGYFVIGPYSDDDVTLDESVGVTVQHLLNCREEITTWANAWEMALKQGVNAPSPQWGRFEQRSYDGGKIFNLSFTLLSGDTVGTYVQASIIKNLHSSLVSPFVTMSGCLDRAQRQHFAMFNVRWFKKASSTIELRLPHIRALDPIKIPRGDDRDGAEWVVMGTVAAAFTSARLPIPLPISADMINRFDTPKGQCAWRIELRLVDTTYANVLTVRRALESALGVSWLRLHDEGEGVMSLWAGAVPRIANLKPKYQENVTELDWDDAWLSAGVKSPSGATPKTLEQRKMDTNPNITQITVDIPPGLSVASLKAKADLLASATRNDFLQIGPGENGVSSATLIVSEDDPLPLMVEHDFNAIDGTGAVLPLGVSYDGTMCSFDPKEMPHVAIMGDTGTGKSVTVQNLVYSALRKGYLVAIIDPLKFAADYVFTDEYLWCPRATTFPTATGTIKAIVAEMERRVALNEQHGANSIDKLPADIRPRKILVLIDEFTSLMNIENVGRADGGSFEVMNEQAMTEYKNSCKLIIGAGAGRIGREARSAGIMLAVAGQSFTKKTFERVSGADTLKESMSRIQLGNPPLSTLQSSLRRPYDSPRMGDPTPKGRGRFEALSTSFIFQSYYSDAEQLLAELRRRNTPMPDSHLDIEPFIPAEPEPITAATEDGTRIVFDESNVADFELDLGDDLDLGFDAGSDTDLDDLGDDLDFSFDDGSDTDLDDLGDTDSGDLDDLGDTDSGDTDEEPFDLGDTDSGDLDDLGDTDSGDLDDLGDTDSGDLDDLGDTDSGDTDTDLDDLGDTSANANTDEEPFDLDDESDTDEEKSVSSAGTPPFLAVSATPDATPDATWGRHVPPPLAMPNFMPLK